MAELNKSDARQLSTILFFTASLIFIYTAARAFLLCITWDEAHTFTEFVRNNKVIVSGYNTMSANNHILNTFLIILCTKAFGVSEFILRIPSLAAHLLFLFYSARLLKQLRNKWLVVTAFIVVNSNPYMLDFFSLARGYSLSLGLMMTSIYYFYLFQTGGHKNKNAVISILTAALAVLANFVLLNYCVILFGLLIFLQLYAEALSEKTNKQKIVSFLKAAAGPTLIMLVLLSFTLPIILTLKSAGALFFGGAQSFWHDTFCTITDRCFYELYSAVWLQRFAKGFVIIIILSAVIFTAFKIAKQKLSGSALFLFSLVLLLILCALSTVVQHHLFGTPYLIDRTALFLTVLFNLTFVFFISELSKSKAAAVWIVHLASLFCLVHFAAAFNLTYVLEWKSNSNTKEMLHDLDKIKIIPKGKETISLGIPLNFEAPINFYRASEGLNWLNTVWRDKTPSPQHDYFYLSPRELAAINKDSIIIIKTYPVTNNVLAKRKLTPHLKPIIEQTISFEKEQHQRFVFNDNVEYSPAFSYLINDSITHRKPAVFVFYADVMAEDLGRDNLLMVISIQDKNDQLYLYQTVPIKDFIKNKKERVRASFTCIVPPEIKQGDLLKAYIWNPDKDHLFVKDMQFKWLEYEN